MIVAAFAGTGKTECARRYKDVIDLEVMPYKYSNLTEENTEYQKASEELKLIKNWRFHYYGDLLEYNVLNEKGAVLMPSDFQILSWLECDELDYILVFPNESLKEEYRERYIKRGNREEFINVFIDNWDYWIGMFNESKCPNKVILKSGQYLSDVIEKLGLEITTY